MKKWISIFPIFVILFFTIHAQHLVVEGELQISQMPEKNQSDSLVIWQNNGILGIRSASSLSSNSSTISPWFLGKDTLDGIVYYIYTDNMGHQHGFIIAKEEGFAKWQNEPEKLINADRSWDGSFNTDSMSNSPAKDYVIDSFDTNWYVPSIDELILLWNNRYHVNKALQGSGHPLVRLSDSYWSSTEYGFRDAWYIPFSNGNVTFGWKGISRYVRPIRHF